MQIDDLEWSWNQFGKDDPLWAVLTDPRCQYNNWDVDEFFATGTEFLERIDRSLKIIIPDLDRGHALDFGCGVGRLTQALANHFDTVVGVDIAASMVAKANTYNRHGDRCTYHVNLKADLSLFATNSFNFVMTFMVFQHMPPELVLGYIKEFVRILKPGGVAFFQVPIAEAESKTQALVAKGETPSMAMFPTPLEDIREAVKEASGEEVLAEEGDGAPGWVSYHVVIRKR